MSQPKILDAVNELDENGFYNRSTYLGDIRTSSTCLDSTLENGIYVFTGGTSSPTDTNGTHRWSLHVFACQECTTVRQEAKRLDANVNFIRHYVNKKWSTFASTDISVPSASTSTAGIVKLENSTSSTSTTTAATPNAVKDAYDLANTAKSSADSALSTANEAKNSSSNAMPKSGGTFTGDVTMDTGKDLIIKGGSTNYTSYLARGMSLSTSAATPTTTGNLIGVYT